MEVFDVSCPPMAGGETLAITPWRSYDVAEEVQNIIFPPPYITWRLLTNPFFTLYQAAAACWQAMPDAQPPSILLSLMSGSFHSIRVRTVQVPATARTALSQMSHIDAANRCKQ